MSETRMRHLAGEAAKSLARAREMPPGDQKVYAIELAAAQTEGTLELLGHELDMRIRFGGKRPIRDRKSLGL